MNDKRCVDRNSQLLPPGTQRPAWPFAALQESCLRLVSATQQLPLGTGRFWFWRATMVESWGRAAAKAARPRMMVARDRCMLAGSCN